MRNQSFVFITTAVLIAGCTGAQNQRISSSAMEMDNLRREVRFLKQQNSQLLRELDDLKKQIEEVSEANNRVRADLAAQIDEITTQLDNVQSGIQDTNYRLSSMNQRGKLGTADANPPGVDTKPDTLKQMIDPQNLAVDNSTTLYNTAYRDLSRGNYQLALQGFRQFVNEYPNADLTDNAQYWIGEVYYAQGRYQNAIDEFERVVKWYRTGDKTASALLKIAFSYLNMEETEQGKIYLQEVLKDYPDSDEASRARGRLASLE